MAQRLARIALVGDGFVAVSNLGAPVAGANGNLVQPCRPHLLLDRPLRTGAHRHHGQHRGHADGDAKHGQHRLQSIATQSLDRGINNGMTPELLHGWLPHLRGNASGVGLV